MREWEEVEEVEEEAEEEGWVETSLFKRRVWSQLSMLLDTRSWSWPSTCFTDHRQARVG